MTKAIYALVIAVFIFAGCSHHEDHEGHDHDHEAESSSHQQIELEKEQLTLFTNQMELFVEYDPLIMNHESEFLAHFTILDDNYTAVDNAVVVLSIQLGYENTTYEGHSHKAGIYHFDVEPKNYGEADLSFIVNGENINDVFNLNHQHIFESINDVHSHNHGETGGDIQFLKEQAWKSDFNVQPVYPRPFSAIVKASGELMAMPGEKQNLIAKNEGIVMFTKQNLVQGSKVKKGELLFTISSEGLTDNNINVEYQEAYMQFDKSKSQYERHSKLVDEKIISQSQFKESLNRYIADSVAYYNLKRNVSNGGLKVFAPLGGYIHELNVSEGQFVETGHLISTISSNKVMLLRADVSQTQFAQLDQISDATFRPAYTSRVYTIAELKGTLLAKASSVAENNHYMPVYFEVINDGSLLEGAFAEFYLKTSDKKNSLVIPNSSIIEEQSAYFIYKQISGESYSKQQVYLGSTDGIYTEIVSGLTAGDRVVTKGAMLIKASSVTASPIHSHSH